MSHLGRSRINYLYLPIFTGIYWYCILDETGGEDDDDETGGSCSDSNADCATWAAAGECSRNPSFMNLSCRKSCNKCRGGGGSGRK